jgi:uncharacterized protein
MDGEKAIGPVRGEDRIEFLDVVRGFALLGILLMNVLTFGLPEKAYSNPNYGGGSDPLNVGTWVGIYLAGEGKMRALFSMMFGAGCLLFLNRGIAKGGGIEVADFYFRRTFWLMIFGIFHAFLIWWGDILYPYALMGFLLFLFRQFSVRALIVTCSIMLVLLTGAMVGGAFDNRSKLEKYDAIQKLDLESTELTKEQKEQLDEGQKLKEDLYPKPEKIQEELDAYRGSYLQNAKERAKAVWRFHKLPIYFPFLWDMLSMMLLGMALVKTGVLTAERSNAFYRKMAAIGLIAGLALNGSAMFLQLRHDFDPIRGLFDMTTYEIGRVPMALCYIAVLALIVKAGRAVWLTRRLRDVGRMAFSNYIAHSLICSVIFYGGYGFGLIGKLERWQLYLVVLGIWIFNLTWSPIWLRRFQFGPLEWAWRSLTYWKRQPMRIQPPSPPALEPAPPVATLQ